MKTGVTLYRFGNLGEIDGRGVSDAVLFASLGGRSG